MSTQGRFDGRVVVVTGAARGIGEGIARRFAAEGAQVMLGDIDAEGVEKTASAMGALADWNRCDVTQEADVQALVAAAVDRFGRLDVMVNNAGAIGARGSILDIAVEDWDATMALLLRSVFLGMKAAGRVLVDQGEGGAIISTSSVAAHSPGNGPHAYGTAKAAVAHLTQRVALELAEQRIRVNAVCPGSVVTALVADAVGVGPESYGVLEEMTTAMRAYPAALGVEDIAAAVAWLASDDGTMVNGQVITVDGAESVGPRWSNQMMK
jgi:NAD(P)-dependent dehydrogenase (short-subunit alcohol dehydrogenase family)